MQKNKLKKIILEKKELEENIGQKQESNIKGVIKAIGGYGGSMFGKM